MRTPGKSSNSLLGNIVKEITAIAACLRGAHQRQKSRSHHNDRTMHGPFEDHEILCNRWVARRHDAFLVVPGSSRPQLQPVSPSAAGRRLVGCTLATLQCPGSLHPAHFVGNLLVLVQHQLLIFLFTPHQTYQWEQVCRRACRR